jgi:hypothetical protein
MKSAKPVKAGPAPIDVRVVDERQNKGDVKGLNKVTVDASNRAKKSKKNDARTAVPPFNKR